jgi:hypothetical protein
VLGTLLIISLLIFEIDLVFNIGPLTYSLRVIHLATECIWEVVGTEGSKNEATVILDWPILARHAQCLKKAMNSNSSSVSFCVALVII